MAYLPSHLQGRHKEEGDWHNSGNSHPSSDEALVEWHIPEGWWAVWGTGGCGGAHSPGWVLGGLSRAPRASLLGPDECVYIGRPWWQQTAKLREHLLRNNFLFYLALFSCLPLLIRWTHRISEASSGGCCFLPVRNPQRWNSDHFSSEPSWWWASFGFWVQWAVGGGRKWPE